MCLWGFLLSKCIVLIELVKDFLSESWLSSLKQKKIIVVLEL